MPSVHVLLLSGAFVLVLMSATTKLPSWPAVLCLIVERAIALAGA